MKILVISDLHGQRSILPKVDKYLEKNKFFGVFMLGDLCNRNDPNALLYAQDFIDLITKKHILKLFVIHGNNEPEAVKLLYQQRNISVHFNPKKIVTYEVAIDVVGVGYGEIYPSDPDYANNKILLTHEPPRMATLYKMERIDLPNAPIIHFAGHLHKIARIWQLKNSIFVQVPSAMEFRGASYDPMTHKVKFIYF